MTWTTKPPFGTRLDMNNQLNIGLNGLWIFNEESGDKVYDLSGYTNTGILTNMAFPPTTTSGWNPPNGIKFDGIDDFIKISTLQNILNNNLEGTISARINISSSKDHAIFAYTNILDGNTNMDFFINTENRLVFVFRNDTSTSGAEFYTISTNAILSLYTDYMVTVVSNGTYTKLYINGVEQTTTISGINNGKWFGNMNPTTYSTFIGKFERLSGSIQFLKGSINEVRIWNRGLFTNELETLNTTPYGMFIEEEPICDFPICDFTLS